MIQFRDNCAIGTPSMPEVLACLFGIDLQLMGRPHNCSTKSTVIQNARSCSITN